MPWKMVGDRLVIKDCDDCPYAEVGMFVWCRKKKDSHTCGGIPTDCPLPDVEVKKLGR